MTDEEILLISNELGYLPKVSLIENGEEVTHFINHINNDGTQIFKEINGELVPDKIEVVIKIDNPVSRLDFINKICDQKKDEYLKSVLRNAKIRML